MRRAFMNIILVPNVINVLILSLGYFPKYFPKEVFKNWVIWLSLSIGANEGMIKSVHGTNTERNE